MTRTSALEISQSMSEPTLSAVAPVTRLRVLIADDEPLGRDMVRLALDHDTDVDVVGEATNAAEAVHLIRELSPDLVFLDVQMPGGDGFEVVEEIGPEHMPPLVFVTAYDTHALRAFDAHAIDYVLKPFSNDRFGQAMERARELIRVRDTVALEAKLRAILQDVRPDRQPLARIAVKDDDRYFFIRAQDIDWFEGAGNYVRIHVRQKQFRVRISLRELARQLDPTRFRRIHRSTIVNVDRIAEVQPWFGGDYVAILTDGQKLRVSRTFAGDLLRTTQ